MATQSGKHQAVGTTERDSTVGGSAAVAAVFTALVPLAFSDTFIEAALRDYSETTFFWVLLGTDLVLVLIVILAGVLAARPAGPREERRYPWRWAVAGAVFVLILDGVFAVPGGPFEDRPALGDVGVSLLDVLALAILVAATVGANPVRLVTRKGQASDPDGWARFRPAIPLLLGTLAAYVGSIVWARELDPEAVRTPAEATEDDGCEGAIDREYFSQLTQVIPLLMVAVGLEARFFFQRLLGDPYMRAMTIVTLLVLVAGEALAISGLPESNSGCGDILLPWHEYAAFVVTLEACFVALALLVLALIDRDPEEPPGAAAKPEG